ncbi:MAG: PP2C family protein-serine/threonine phosphatase, partial [Planctomycetota bacterium]
MRILLVDDEPLIRETIGSFLELAGHHVAVAKDVAQALAHVQEHAGQIDLIMSDVCMPGGNGMQLLEQVRESQPDIDAVLMTGYSDQLGARQALEAGASAFLRKPVKMDDLEMLLTQIDNARKNRTRIQRLDRSLHTARRQRKESEQDRLFARRLHARMFPKDFSWLRRTEVVLRHLPMAGIGGDFADLRPYGDGKALILVADVSGHGTPAAFGGMALKTWFQTVPLGLTPSAVLAQGDAMMAEIFPEEFYATAFCGIWDERDRHLRYVVAGHVPPMLISPSGRPRLLDGDGAALGMALGGQRMPCEIRLQESEALLVATDGLSEQPEHLIEGLSRHLRDYPCNLSQLSRLILDTAIETA